MNMTNDGPSGRNRITLASVLALAMLLTAGPGWAQDRTRLHGHVPAVIRTLQPLGDLDGSTNISLAIGLPLRNTQELTNLLRDIYDPKSTNYHHYLTPAQFTERFGPTRRTTRLCFVLPRPTA